MPYTIPTRLQNTYYPIDEIVAAKLMPSKVPKHP